MHPDRFSLTLCLTHRCDLACAYCYAGRPRAVDMPLPVATAAIDLALERLADGGTLDLGFFGGEPLLAWGLIDTLLDEVPRRAEERGVQVLFGMTTNGTRLTPERFDRLDRTGAAIALSLDGTRSIHDRQRPSRCGGSSFDRVSARLEDLGPERAGRLRSVLVVTPGSCAQLADGVDAILRLGIGSIEFNLDYHARWPREARDELARAALLVADLYADRALAGRPFGLSWIDTTLSAVLAGGYPERFRCGFGRGELAVAPSGRLYPCERLIGEDLDPRHSIGTVEAPAAPPPRRTGSCDAGRFCLSWCRCNNLVRTGDPDTADDLIHDVCRLQLEMAARVAGRLELSPIPRPERTLA